MASNEEMENEIADGEFDTEPVDNSESFKYEDDDSGSLVGEELSDEEVRASFDEDDEDHSDDGDPLDITDEELEIGMDVERRSTSWHLAPSLVRLRAEINKKWPNRSKASDGTIGDATHSARTSDHNPNNRHSVNAFDVTTKGISPMTLVNAAKKHPSTHYVIYNKIIYNRDYGFAARRYTGTSDPHITHLHLSIKQTSTAESSTKSWLTTAAAPAPKPLVPRAKFVLRDWPFGTNHKYYYKAVTSGTPHTYDNIELVQRKLYSLGYTVGSFDGQFGPKLLAAVKKFQGSNGLDDDGLIGYLTWQKLRSK